MKFTATSAVITGAIIGTLLGASCILALEQEGCARPEAQMRTNSYLMHGEIVVADEPLTNWNSRQRDSVIIKLQDAVANLEAANCSYRYIDSVQSLTDSLIIKHLSK